MPNAILWQWAKDNGYSYEYLAERLGYTSPRYVMLVLRGWEKMSDSFIGKFVQAFPDDAFLLLDLSDNSEAASEMAITAKATS